jgi:glycerophosphoryl diester phosphodiesterase
VPAVTAWIAKLDPTSPSFEHDRLEGLWTLRHFDQVPLALLEDVLTSPDPRSRAAGMRVLAAVADRTPKALEWVVRGAGDDSPRVRLEAVRTATYLRDPAAIEALAVAGDFPWHTLSQLDAGGWHSSAYAGEPLATLAQIARFCISSGYLLNIEIKPTTGTERNTGGVVAHHAARLWQGVAVPPLLTSFDIAALEGALATQPELPRGLLIHALEDQSWAQWLGHASRLQCQAIVCNYDLWNAESIALAKAAGFRLLSYTVNDDAVAAQLQTWGTDGIITDRVDHFVPSA